LQLSGAGTEIRRPDRLVGFLGVLGLALILARRVRNVLLAVIGADDAPYAGNRLLGDLHAVGSHIGDETDRLAADVDAFVEPLRQAHGVRRRKAELAARLLPPRCSGETPVTGAAPRLWLD